MHIQCINVGSLFIFNWWKCGKMSVKNKLISEHCDRNRFTCEKYKTDDCNGKVSTKDNCWLKRNHTKLEILPVYHKSGTKFLSLHVTPCINKNRFIKQIRTEKQNNSRTSCVSSSSWNHKPPSSFINGHVLTRHCSRSVVDLARPHLCWFARHRQPWPLRKQFSRHHMWGGRWKRGCWTARLVTAVWSSTEEWEVFSPLCNSVNRCHVWSHWMPRCKPCKTAVRYRHT